MIDAAFTFAKKYMRQKVNKDTDVGQAAGEEDVKRQSSWKEPMASRFLQYRFLESHYCAMSLPESPAGK